MTAWKDLSDTTKALVYLGGLVAGAFLGGVASRPLVDALTSIPSDVSVTKADLQKLETRVKVLEDASGSFVTVGSEITLSDKRASGEQFFLEMCLDVTAPQCNTKVPPGQTLTVALGRSGGAIQGFIVGRPPQ
jgi:hypothetical protein